MTEVRSAVLVSVVGPARPGLTQAGLVGGVKDITQRSSSGKVSLPSWVDVRRGSGTGSGPGPELGRVPEMRGEGGGLGSEAASQADGLMEDGEWSIEGGWGCLWPGSLCPRLEEENTPLILTPQALLSDLCLVQ